MDLDELRKRVGTVVIVMMENRSFDHVLGHMSLPDFGARKDVNGIPSLADPAFGNVSSNGTMIAPFVRKDAPFPNDLPHERDRIKQQLAKSSATGAFTMNGFVTAYEEFTGTTGVLQPPPMGLLPPADLPMTRFLVDEYLTCDAWHAPLPASTQPNRLMALSGYTQTDVTQNGLLPDQDTFLDWLTNRGVRWRVYSAGLSIFMLMPKMWPLLLTEQFRGLPALSHDAQHEDDTTWPEVVLIEPDYNDSPVHLSGHPCDNHPPLPIAFGESFLRQIYEAMTPNDPRWARTLLIYTYDEHGGFFDHVAPPPVPCRPRASAGWKDPFTSAGIRVPAVVVSPMVARGAISHATLDHTSILQLLAERFGKNGEPYSAEVEARRKAGIASVSSILTSGTARGPAPPAPTQAFTATASLITTATPKSPSELAFAHAAEQFARAHGQAALQKFPEIAHWV